MKKIALFMLSVAALITFSIPVNAEVIAKLKRSGGRCRIPCAVKEVLVHNDGKVGVKKTTCRSHSDKNCPSTYTQLLLIENSELLSSLNRFATSWSNQPILKEVKGKPVSCDGGSITLSVKGKYDQVTLRQFRDCVGHFRFPYSTGSDTQTYYNLENILDSAMRISL